MEAAGNHASGRGPSTRSTQPRASACSVAPDAWRTTAILRQKPAITGLCWLKSLAIRASKADFSSEDVIVTGRLVHEVTRASKASALVSSTATTDAAAKGCQRCMSRSSPPPS